MPPVAQVRTLGPVELLLAGAPAPRELTWTKPLAMLVYLARSPRRVRARDHLTGLLWPDKPEAAARHSLDVEVARLRKHLGGGSLVTEGERIRLADGVVALDVTDIEGAIAAGDWERAAAHVFGEFMQGFRLPGASAFEDWLSVERTAWRNHGVTALTSAADVHLAAGRVRAAAALAHRAVELDPVSDRAARCLMRALALAGDRGTALRAFDDLAARLALQDLEPDHESQALAARIRAERAWRAPPPVEHAMSRRVPLVGREHELLGLAGAWNAVRAGKSGVLMVLGDAGSGRTRMAEELAGRARLDGAACVVMRAVLADREHPWSGWRALAGAGLSRLPGVAAASPGAVAAFASASDEWDEAFRGARNQAGPLPPGAALTDVLRAITHEQPLLLVLDDAHHLDAPTLLALEAALRDLHAMPLAVLLTLAPHPPRAELDGLRARIGRDLAGAAVTLAPLGRPEHQQLIDWAFGDAAPAERERLARRLVAESAGLALLAVELLHAMSLGLELGGGGKSWLQEGRTLDQTLPGELPDSIVAAVRVGFSSLSPHARLLLEALAIMPDAQPAATLAAMTALSREDADSALDDLEYHRWVTSDSRGYAYVASIIRSIIERDMVTAGKRRRMLERLNA